MLSHHIGIDDKLLDYASVLDDRYKIVETIGEGRYAKYLFKLRVKLAIDLQS